MRAHDERYPNLDKQELERLNKELNYVNRDLEVSALELRDLILSPNLNSLMTSVAQVPDTSEGFMRRKRIHIEGQADSILKDDVTEVTKVMIPIEISHTHKKHLKRLSTHMPDIAENYFRIKDGHANDSDFSSTLWNSSRYSRFKTIASLHFADHFFNSSSSIVSSIEFDKDDEFFATAGVTKKIKMFQCQAILSASDTSHGSSFITKRPNTEAQRKADATNLDLEDHEVQIPSTPNYPIKEMNSTSKIRYFKNVKFQI